MIMSLLSLKDKNSCTMQIPQVKTFFEYLKINFASRSITFWCNILTWRRRPLACLKCCAIR